MLGNHQEFEYNGMKVIHGKMPIRFLGIRYNIWLDSTAQRRYVMDGITELACFLRKNRDLSIENSLRLIECTLAPLLAFSGPVIIWPGRPTDINAQGHHTLSHTGSLNQMLPI